ncbi:G-type lectin S-receptor-like serine/threonine-protein kinase At2g19130 [Musa acuminata AAA Group]|uniref:G-type lectin S-receptor-like serine/threonine-protein kinase At2g19130 n=1 Tax=Musa acuminata AAA Group TaxID=214697 RepID=UPI0031E079D0
MDPDGSNQYVILWNGSEIYWICGLWNGQHFTGVPGTTESTAFNFTFVDNSDRKFATYTITDSAFITHYVIDSAGQSRQWYWLNTTQEWQTVFTQPLAHCDVYSLCGAFGICNQKSSQLCQCLCGNRTSDNGEKDGFLFMPNVGLPPNPRRLTAGSDKECKAACLSNCSCTAYSFQNGCTIWSGALRILRQLDDGDKEGGGPLYIRLATTDLPSSSGSSHKLTTGIVIGIAAAGVVISFFAVFVLIWACRRRKITQTSKQADASLIPFPYSDLQRATKNFSEKLGGGGFGVVYKGTLPDSAVVAVKKLEVCSGSARSNSEQK